MLLLDMDVIWANPKGHGLCHVILGLWGSGPGPWGCDVKCWACCHFLKKIKLGFA